MRGLPVPRRTVPPVTPLRGRAFRITNQTSGWVRSSGITGSRTRPQSQGRVEREASSEECRSSCQSRLFSASLGTDQQSGRQSSGSAGSQSRGAGTDAVYHGVDSGSSILPATGRADGTGGHAPVLVELWAGSAAELLVELAARAHLPRDDVFRQQRQSAESTGVRSPTGGKLPGLSVSGLCPSATTATLSISLCLSLSLFSNGNNRRAGRPIGRNRKCRRPAFWRAGEPVLWRNRPRGSRYGTERCSLPRAPGGARERERNPSSR
jgi:hypothetical protein